MLQALTANGAALDASDTGTGKMYVACAVARQLKVTPLVIAPKSTLAEWRKVAVGFGLEVEAVNYERVRGTRRNVDIDDGEARLASSEWGEESISGHGSRWTWKEPYEFVIFDEVHRCGGMTSLNSKLLLAAARQARYVLCLSATAANDPRQFKALGYTLQLFELSKFRWWLLRHGCEPGIYGGFDLTSDPVEQQQAMARIHSQIFPRKGSRMCKETIPGFPKTQIDVRLLDDTTGRARTYAYEIRDAFTGQHLKELIAARQAIELMKVSYLVDMVEDYARSSKVIVFLNFTKTIDALREKLEKIFPEIPVIDGRNSSAEEREIIKTRFQNNEFSVLLANSQAGGVGIGLHDPAGQIERTSLISPSYNSKDMKQVLGRPQREGGGFSRQFFIYFANTLEEKVASAVQQGLQNIDALNGLTDATLNGVFE